MRITEILSILERKHEFTLIAELMEALSVSKRSIQNDLAVLEKDSSRGGFTLRKKRGQGYLLEIENIEQFNAYLCQMKNNQYKTKEEMIERLKFILLTGFDFLSMEDISQIIGISRNQLQHYLSEVEDDLEKHNLSLERRPHYGIRVSGEIETRKRMMIETLVQGSPSFLCDFTCRIDQEKVKTIYALLLNQLNKYHFEVNYHELNQIWDWMKVTIYLNQIQKTKHQNYINSKTNLSKITEALSRKIETSLNVYLTHADHQSFEKILEINLRNPHVDETLISVIVEDINEFFNQIDQQYKMSFSKDIDFKKMLALHVSMLVDRSKRDISYKNPLVEEIVIRYPSMFNMAASFCTYLEEKYKIQISQDEIGFIASYFMVHMEKESDNRLNMFEKIAVVCSSGGGSSMLMKMKLQSLFEKANIQTFSFLEMNQLEQFNPDLIFSIKELQADLQVPIIYIQELVDDDDIESIKNYLKYETVVSKKNLQLQPLHEGLFIKKFFRQIRQPTDYKSLLETMAQELEIQGYGGENYAAYVMERESFMSTIYNNGVAMPHPIQMSGQKNALSVALIDKDMCFEEDKSVRMVVMISLRKQGYELLKEVTKHLYEMMNDGPYIQRLTQVNSFEEFISVIKER